MDYETALLGTVTGQPFLLTQAEPDEPDLYELWTLNRNETSHSVQRYEVAFAQSADLYMEYELNDTNTDNAPVVGFGADRYWLYIARRTGNQSITLERVNKSNGTRDYRNETLTNVPVSFPESEAGPDADVVQAYRLQVNDDQILLVPRGAVAASSQEPQAISVDIPKFGGGATWKLVPAHEVNGSFSPATPSMTMATSSPTPTPKQTSTSIPAIGMLSPTLNTMPLSQK